MNEFESLGQYVKAIREQRNMSRRTLGQLVGVPASTITDIENGTNPTEHFLPLVRALELDFFTAMQCLGKLARQFMQDQQVLPQDNLPPRGVSILEHQGVAFTEERQERCTFRINPNRQPKVLTWKDEDGSGPVWIDGLPLVEFRDDGEDYWMVAWYSRRTAQKMARERDATFIAW